MTWQGLLETPQQILASEEPQRLHSPKAKAPSIYLHPHPSQRLLFAQPMALVKEKTRHHESLRQEVPGKCGTWPLSGTTRKIPPNILCSYNNHVLVKHIPLPGFLLANSLTTLLLFLTLTVCDRYHFYYLYFFLRVKELAHGLTTIKWVLNPQLSDP